MKLRRTARLLMTAVLILSMVMPVKSKAASNSISDAKQKQSKAQEELDSKKGEITSLEKLKSDLDTYLADINEQTAELSDSLLELETQSAEKQTELEQTQKELEEAKATEAAQYEDMKKRIKFMYESSNTEYIDLLLSAENFTDFLNRAENISSISTYDRNMLMEYEATKITIVEKEQKIQEESKALEELLAQTQAKQDELYATANSTKEKISGYVTKISTAEQEAAGYKNEVNSQQGVINELIAKAEAEEQARKAAEEKARAAAEEKVKKEAEEKAKKEQEEANKNQTKPDNNQETSPPSSGDNTENESSGSNNNTNEGGSIPSNSDDLTLLAALIQCEAGGESYEGQVAVGAVVINRVKSGSFPGSVAGVIYQSGQFSPVASGRLALVLEQGPRSSCMQAAGEALSGVSNVGGSLFFRVADGREGLIIGNHVFY